VLKVYHASRTRSIRVLWLLEEMKSFYDVDYQLEKVDFAVPGSSFFNQKTPSGKIPVLEDGDIQIFESGAIIEYLLEEIDRDQHFSPRIHSRNRAAFLQWMHYAEGTLATPLSTLLWHLVYKKDAQQLPEVITDAKTRAVASLEPIESSLLSEHYLLGKNFSAADIMLGFTIGSAKLLGVFDSRFPRLTRYLERLQSRPAFQTATSI
jgi:glutathione S-transferase